MNQKNLNMFTWANSLITNKITRSLITVKVYHSIVIKINDVIYFSNISISFNLFCDHDLGKEIEI